MVFCHVVFILITWPSPFSLLPLSRSVEERGRPQNLDTRLKFGGSPVKKEKEFKFLMALFERRQDILRSTLNLVKWGKDKICYFVQTISTTSLRQVDWFQEDIKVLEEFSDYTRQKDIDSLWTNSCTIVADLITKCIDNLLSNHDERLSIELKIILFIYQRMSAAKKSNCG